MTTKTCFKCFETKPMNDFYQHPFMADGRLNKCKECTKKDSINNRKKNLTYYRGYDKIRSKQPKRSAALRLKSERKVRRMGPIYMRAHNLVNKAIKTGALIRPFSCGR